LAEMVDESISEANGGLRASCDVKELLEKNQVVSFGNMIIFLIFRNLLLFK